MEKDVSQCDAVDLVHVFCETPFSLHHVSVGFFPPGVFGYDSDSLVSLSYWLEEYLRVRFSGLVRSRDFKMDSEYSMISSFEVQPFNGLSSFDVPVRVFAA